MPIIGATALDEPITTPPLSPSDFGFDPTRFPEFRPSQVEKALDIYYSDKRFHFLDAPTGTGKSHICLLAGLVGGPNHKLRTLIVTATKALQSQYMRDATVLGAADIRGQQNYRCLALDRHGVLSGYGREGSSCADGPCKVGVHCSLRNGGCTYFDAMARAAQSEIVVTNYALWLTLARHSDPYLLGQFDLLVLDEVHEAGSRLVEFCAVELNRTDVRRLLNTDLPPIDEGVDVWVSWAKTASSTARLRIKLLKQEVKERLSSNLKQQTADLLRLVQLERDLTEMSKARGWKRANATAVDAAVAGTELDWVASETPAGAKFSPVWAAGYAEQYLFRGIPKVVLSSGTLLPSTKRRLGLHDSVIEWHTVKSSFSPRRRPVYYLPAYNGQGKPIYIDRRAGFDDYERWIELIDQILRTRMDRKCLIHSISYDRAEYIKRCLIALDTERYGGDGVIITHRPDTHREAVEQFKKAAAPCILISPSMKEGVDFPGDQLRVIIVAKVPYASSSDPVFKARCKDDPLYRFECAALDIIQMCGRGMRAADDQVESFVVDGHFGYLRTKVQWPTWFKLAWEWPNRVPPPLKLDTAGAATSTA